MIRYVDHSSDNFSYDFQGRATKRSRQSNHRKSPLPSRIGRCHLVDHAFKWIAPMPFGLSQQLVCALSCITRGIVGCTCDGHADTHLDCAYRREGDVSMAFLIFSPTIATSINEVIGSTAMNSSPPFGRQNRYPAKVPCLDLIDQPISNRRNQTGQYRRAIHSSR